MKRQPRGRHCLPMNRWQSEDGFTFIEILVSLVLFAVLGVVVWTALLQAQRLIGKVTLRASQSAKILQADDMVRHYAAQIRIPFWVGKLEDAGNGKELVLPYLNGDADDVLLLRQNQGMLVIGSQSSGQMAALGPFTSIQFNIKSSSESKPWGLVVTLGVGGPQGEAVDIYAPFGGIPF